MTARMRSSRILPLLLLAATACTTGVPSPSVAPSPAKPWSPPASAIPPPLERPATPAIETPLTLERAIDIALTNNPNTHTAWLRARAAEANLGSARSALLPEIDANASITRTQHATVYGPSLGLTYLLFDFGGRSAFIDEARQALIAADYTHNQVIQDIVLLTVQAYYGVLEAKALLEAQGATVKDRRTSVDAANARHNAGVATIADVLEAQTALSQAQLNYDTFAGQLRQQQGLLSTTLGVPVTTPIEIGALPAEVPVQEMADAVDALVKQAEEGRPELGAARAEVERARAVVREVRSSFLPSVGVTANVGKTYVSGTSTSPTSPYSVGLALRFPLFTGFRNVYDTRAAQLGVSIAAEEARNLQQQVGLEVWSSYFALTTAGQRIRTSRDLLSSASQSLDVAAGRYRSGVGTILELLTAQAALEAARAQEVQARTDWFVAVAQLAHDTGRLGPAAGETQQ